jgi:hypothetical protein
LPGSAAAIDNAKEKVVVKVVVGRAVGIAIDEAASTNAIAVGRAAHGKRDSSPLGEVAVRSKQQKTSAPANVIISTLMKDLLAAPSTNDETSFKKVLLTIPTMNNETTFKEVQVCWLCGGTHCD